MQSGFSKVVDWVYKKGLMTFFTEYGLSSTKVESHTGEDGNLVIVQTTIQVPEQLQSHSKLLQDSLRTTHFHCLLEA